MTLSEYLAWWRQRPADDTGSHSGAGTLKPLQGHATTASKADSSSSGCVSSVAGGSCNGGQQTAPLLYLKDWHFASEHPHYQASTLIHLFERLHLLLYDSLPKPWQAPTYPLPKLADGPALAAAACRPTQHLHSSGTTG